MSKDVDFMNVGAIWLHGPDFEKYHDRILRGRFKGLTITPLDTHIRSLRRDVSLIRWSWKIEGETAADGAPLPTRFGLMTLVAEKRKGTWLVVAAQNTNAGPPRAEAEGIVDP